MLADRDRLVGEGFPFFDDRDRQSYEHVEGEFRKLAQGVDPDDPWSHPRARELDGVSVSTWLRAQGATYNVVRARELVANALAADRRAPSLLPPAQGSRRRCERVYARRLECQRVAEGSANGKRVATELGPSSLRHTSPRSRSDRAPAGAMPRGAIQSEASCARSPSALCGMSGGGSLARALSRYTRQKKRVGPRAACPTPSGRDTVHDTYIFGPVSWRHLTQREGGCHAGASRALRVPFLVRERRSREHDGREAAGPSVTVPGALQDFVRRSGARPGTAATSNAMAKYPALCMTESALLTFGPWENGRGGAVRVDDRGGGTRQ